MPSLVCVVSTLLTVAAPPDAEVVPRVEAYLGRFHAAAPLPGFSVVVVRDGRVVLERGWGVEVVGQDRPMTADSSVGVGSLGKSFTALAVMQLVERGLVNLDDPIVKHLPWFKTADEAASRRITVRTLLSNTSGLPSADGLWFGDLDASDEAMERLARALSRYRSRREPGTSFEYSNEGWTVLGVLVQRLSGEGYADYLERHVLGPLEMRRSTTKLARLEELGALHGHTSEVRGFSPAPPHYQAASMPAGTILHASARDLGHYLVALLDGGVWAKRRVLSAQGAEKLWRPAIGLPGPPVEEGGTGEQVHYALGWMVDEIDGRTVVYHPGGTRTMTSETFLEPGTRSAVAILVNADALDPYRWTTLRTVANNVLHLVNGRPLSDFGTPRRKDPTLNAYELPGELVGRYEGSYLDPGGNRIDLTACGKRVFGAVLHGGLPSGVELDFTSEAGVVLRNVSSAVRAAFLVTPEGRVSALTLDALAAGGPYRRMPLPSEDLVWTTSPGKEVAFPLPRGWRVAWSGDRFEARPSDGSGLGLAGGRSGDPVGGLRAPPAASTHVDTVAGRVWREGVGTDDSGGGLVQWASLRSRVGAWELEIVARAPDGKLTGLLRDVVNGVLRNLRVGSGRVGGPGPGDVCARR